MRALQGMDLVPFIDSIFCQKNYTYLYSTLYSSALFCHLVEGPEPETTIPEFFEGHEVGTAQNSFLTEGA